MDFKHRAKEVFGVVVVLAGVCLSLSILSGLVFGGIRQRGGALITVFRLGFLVLNAALAVYLFYYGWRMVSPKTVTTFRFGWGKIVFGALILYVQVGFDYHLVPMGPIPIHMPSNLPQSASVLALDLIAVYLIFRGLWAGFSRHKPEPGTLPQSLESGR